MFTAPLCPSPAPYLFYYYYYFIRTRSGKSLKVSRSETTIERPHLSFHLRLGLPNGFLPTYITPNTLPPPASSSFFSSSSSSSFFFFFFLFCFYFSRIRIICSESNGQFLKLAFPSFYWSSYFLFSPHTMWPQQPLTHPSNRVSSFGNL